MRFYFVALNVLVVIGFVGFVLALLAMSGVIWQS